MSVNKIGGRRIVDHNGNDLGDIDVLGIHSPSRTLVAVEAKDFEIARTPSELAGEIEKLFAGGTAKRSTVELHSRRLKWLSDHLTDVVREMGGQADSSWRVAGAIVTSDPLVSPLSISSPIPVIPLEDLAPNSFALSSPSHLPKRRAGKGSPLKRQR